MGDFGIGGIAAAAAAVRSRIGASTIDFLSLADQASLFRGAGTPLYMSPEQRRGAAPDPRHDLYALGVMWFQLLVGDVSRELPHGWAKELTVRHGVPADHVALIERCVGWMDERPKDAGELLPLLRAAVGSAGTTVEPPPPAAAQAAVPTVSNAAQLTPSPPTEGRRRGLAAALARLGAAYDELNDMAKWTFGSTARWGLLFAGLAFCVPPMIAGPRYLAQGVAVSVFVAPLVWAVYVFLMRSGVQRVADDLRMKAEKVADEIAAEFPAEVAELGGRTALRHAPTVRRLRAGLDDRPPAPLSATAGLGADALAADPTRKALLLARLEEVQTTRKDVSDGKDVLHWLAIPLGGLFGGGIVGGITYAGLRDAFRFNEGDAVGFSVMAVGSFFVVLWRLVVAGRRHYDRRWKAVTTRFESDYAGLVAAWGGPAILQSNETVAALIRVFDPSAGRGPVSFIRRLFGG